MGILCKKCCMCNTVHHQHIVWFTSPAVIYFSLSEGKSSLPTSRSRRLRVRWGKMAWLMDIRTLYRRFEYLWLAHTHFSCQSFLFFPPYVLNKAFFKKYYLFPFLSFYVLLSYFIFTPFLSLTSEKWEPFHSLSCPPLTCPSVHLRVCPKWKRQAFSPEEISSIRQLGAEV